MSHKCFVAKIEKTIPIEGADSIQIGIVLGEQVVISKAWEEGKVGLFFPPELQLSEEFCRVNNLHRDSSLNADPDSKGFFDKNRKVRCQPFMKVKSEGFFCEMSAISSFVKDTRLDLFTLGTQFDEIEGQMICQKFISEKTKNAIQNKSLTKKTKADVPHFKMHVDSSQFKYEAGTIPKGSLLRFDAKVHGTSARYAFTKVEQTLTWWQKAINKVHNVFPQYDWDYVVGTRRVTMFEKDRKTKEGFHGSEEYRFEVLDLLKPHLVKGMCIFGEIAGHANTKPIMGVHSTDTLKNKEFKKKYGKEMLYKYGCSTTDYRFHVYRITMTGDDGIEIDYSPQQVDQWCSDRGLIGPLEVHPPMIYDGDVDNLKALVEQLTERPECLTEDYIDPSHINEGVIVRVDNGRLVPKFYKSKSYAFRVLEGIANETTVDLEDAS